MVDVCWNGNLWARNVTFNHIVYTVECVFDTAVPITFLSLAAQQHEVIAPISLKYVGSCNLFSLSKRISKYSPSQGKGDVI